MVNILMGIGDYSIGGYCWFLIDIILAIIGDYWWLLVIIPL
jgi:hypothetical protein